MTEAQEEDPRVSQLTIWSLSSAEQNISNLVSLLPKKYPMQKVWILDGSGTGAAEKAIRLKISCFSIALASNIFVHCSSWDRTGVLTSL